jgi:hypothetical protein
VCVCVCVVRVLKLCIARIVKWSLGSGQALGVGGPDVEHHFFNRHMAPCTCVYGQGSRNKIWPTHAPRIKSSPDELIYHNRHKAG